MPNQLRVIMKVFYNKRFIQTLFLGIMFLLLFYGKENVFSLEDRPLAWIILHPIENHTGNAALNPLLFGLNDSISVLISNKTRLEVLIKDEGGRGQTSDLEEARFHLFSEITFDDQTNKFLIHFKIEDHVLYSEGIEVGGISEADRLIFNKADDLIMQLIDKFLIRYPEYKKEPEDRSYTLYLDDEEDFSQGSLTQETALDYYTFIGIKCGLLTNFSSLPDNVKIFSPYFSLFFGPEIVIDQFPFGLEISTSYYHLDALEPGNQGGYYGFIHVLPLCFSPYVRFQLLDFLALVPKLGGGLVIYFSEIDGEINTNYLPMVKLDLSLHIVLWKYILITFSLEGGYIFDREPNWSMWFGAPSIGMVIRF